MSAATLEWRVNRGRWRGAIGGARGARPPRLRCDSLFRGIAFRISKGLGESMPSHLSTLRRQRLTVNERDLVLESILCGFGKGQYELYVACVMPDHVHLLVEPQPKEQGERGETVFWTLNEILRGIRSTTAHRINRLRKRTGPVWEDDYFDRYIRSESDFHEKFHYILGNPWKSRVVRHDEDYPWVWTADLESGRACASHAISGASPESLTIEQKSDDETSSVARALRGEERD